MNTALHEMTKDMQARIRELAYLMWESAGRQQGMAMEYWLQAEKELMSTLQAAAERIMPSSASSPNSERAEKNLLKASPQAAASEPALSAPAPAPAPVQPQATASAPAATQKPAARKPASRAKKA